MASGIVPDYWYDKFTDWLRPQIRNMPTEELETPEGVEQLANWLTMTATASYASGLDATTGIKLGGFMNKRKQELEAVWNRVEQGGHRMELIREIVDTCAQQGH